MQGSLKSLQPKLCFMCHKYTVSQKNDTDVAHYNFNAHQRILVIFGRDVVLLREYASEQ